MAPAVNVDAEHLGSELHCHIWFFGVARLADWVGSCILGTFPSTMLDYQSWRLIWVSTVGGRTVQLTGLHGCCPSQRVLDARLVAVSVCWITQRSGLTKPDMPP